MKKITKTEISIIYKRCLNLVKRKPAEFFSLRKMRGTHGICNWTDLVFNPSGEFLATAYHECIHYLFPEWSETQVLYTEKRVINGVSQLENAAFLKHISSKIYKSEIQRNFLEKIEKKSKYKKRKPLRIKKLSNKKNNSKIK
jgi:hypothetical protein